MRIEIRRVACAHVRLPVRGWTWTWTWSCTRVAGYNTIIINDDSAQRSSAPPREIVKNFHFPATKSVQKGEVTKHRAGYQRSSVPPAPPLSAAGDRVGI
jgi:hypothetical protein